MSKKRRKNKGHPGKGPVKFSKCAWCPRLTQVRPGSVSTPLARYPHSTSKRGVPPLCFVARKTMAILHRIEQEAAHASGN